jgi:hypothetical protein
MKEPKIADLPENFGIVISSGQISAWLTDAYPGMTRVRASSSARLNRARHLAVMLDGTILCLYELVPSAADGSARHDEISGRFDLEWLTEGKAI